VSNSSGLAWSAREGIIAALTAVRHLPGGGQTSSTLLFTRHVQQAAEGNEKIPQLGRLSDLSASNL